MVDSPEPTAEQERRDHLQNLGELLLGIAHEMTTPLGALGSMLDSLERCQRKLQDVADRPAIGPQDQAELREILAHMQQGWPVVGTARQRLQDLVRELRLAGRPDAERPAEPLALVSLIEGDLLLLQFDLKQGITVERRFEAQPTVRGHASLLGQVFLNLLRNAIQALAGHGRITVTVREHDGQAEVIVADDGPGIPPELIDRLFTEACTSKARDEGTGLGLLISARIVRQHGGRIVAANAPGGGAVFTVFLPVA